MDNQTIVFHNTSDGDMELQQVISSIKNYLEEFPSFEYSLVIGSDSQEKLEISSKKKYINLITAIIVHRKGFGGKYFWFRKRVNNVKTLREKIYAEIFASLDFATMFVPQLKKSLNGNSPKYMLEIHVDVGEHGATRDMIKEVVGIISGNGFIAKTKPDSYGATNIADKHT